MADDNTNRGPKGEKPEDIFTIPPNPGRPNKQRKEVNKNSLEYKFGYATSVLLAIIFLIFLLGVAVRVGIWAFL